MNLALDWDEEKRLKNLTKHGMDFRDAWLLFEEPVTLFPDKRNDYGEPRWIAFGKIHDFATVLVCTLRNARIRIISMRRASKQERRYHEEIINSQSMVFDEE